MEKKCSTCKHWQREARFGYCAILDSLIINIWECGEGEQRKNLIWDGNDLVCGKLYVGCDFGCIFWEK